MASKAVVGSELTHHNMSFGRISVRADYAAATHRQENFSASELSAQHARDAVAGDSRRRTICNDDNVCARNFRFFPGAKILNLKHHLTGFDILWHRRPKFRDRRWVDDAGLHWSCTDGHHGEAQQDLDKSHAILLRQQGHDSLALLGPCDQQRDTRMSATGLDRASRHLKFIRLSFAESGRSHTCQLLGNITRQMLSSIPHER